MPIRTPRLDDRRFEDLVEELLGRIPAHTPEYTNPRLGDPGRTLIELFAWLYDTILYRANLIPERQRLAFLDLLGSGLRPARPARGLISIGLADPAANRTLTVASGAVLSGPAHFETDEELTIQPVIGEFYAKRRMSDAESESQSVADALVGLQELYGFEGAGVPYVTTPIFADSVPDAAGFDVVQQTVDHSLWLALLAPEDSSVADIRAALGGGRERRRTTLSLGVAPRIDGIDPLDFDPRRSRTQPVFEISTGREIGFEPEYLAVETIGDSTLGFSRSGVIRLALPDAANIGALPDDVRSNLRAGLGDRPPRLDDPERAARIAGWIRIRSAEKLERLAFSWLGINAVAATQLRTASGIVLGVSNGRPGQTFDLPEGNVDTDSFELEIEEPDAGYRRWRNGPLFRAGRDDRVFELDPEAGRIQLGDRMQGWFPETGMRVRVGRMRAGGGRVGNLPPFTLSDIEARDLRGAVVTEKLAVLQPLAFAGGEDAETLDRAERRIGAELRHGDRAVTEDDFEQLALRVPGVDVGRVEVLPRFLPQQRRPGVPGVVSVMVLPAAQVERAPNPRPDRPFLEAVQGYLDARRPLASELYAIGCEYIPIGLSIGLTVRDGFGPEEVSEGVRDALRRHLWPLSSASDGVGDARVASGPRAAGIGGAFAQGWPLGRAVVDVELQVIASQVDGVESVLGVRLFAREDERWIPIEATGEHGTSEIELEAWQLPELGPLVVVADDLPPSDLRAVPDPLGPGGGVPVPFVPEVC